MVSQPQVLWNVAIKDLSARVLDPDGDHVYDQGFLLSLNSLKFHVVEGRFWVLFLRLSVVSCDNEITALQHIWSLQPSVLPSQSVWEPSRDYCGTA